MRILLLQLKRIGDLILTTPAIAAVREKFPQAHLTLVVSAGAAELLPAIEGIDRSFVARGRITDAAQWFTLARQRYDICLDFTRTDRSAILTALSGARRRLTADHPKQREKIRCLSYNELVPTPITTNHTVDYHLGLLEPLSIRGASQKLRLHLPAAAREKAARVLRDCGISGDFLLLHPGSARQEKFWVTERWVELISWAAARGLPCVLTGGKSPLEQNHIRQIRAQAQEPFTDLSGRIDLLTLGAVIARAQLLVTVDSAPVHFAVAAATPQVALFGPTNPLHWRPRFTPAAVLQAGHAQPVTEFIPKDKPAAMHLISTEQVISAMENLLSAPHGVTL
ncbi:putative lipopolysaccharide heptosyltransferase III [soil metagenome]